MAAPGPRFCPRCGTERVGDMRFCANCGLDLGGLSSDVRPSDVRPSEERPSAAAAAPSADPAVTHPRVKDRVPHRDGPTWSPLLGLMLLVLGLVVAASWLVGIGPFARDGGDAGPVTGAGDPTPTSPFLPAVTSQPSFAPSPGLTAPPVGLTILSPADGAVVGAREVTVIGTAPPGLRITQDVSFGFDRHATADGTGHWAIQIELSEGENQLKFRIGDDPSTAQTMRVTYVAPAAP